MRITVLVNTLTSVQQAVYANHIPFFVYTAKKRPDIDILFITPPRMTIDSARNYAAKVALNSQCDYLMFLDDDVLIPPDALIKLLDNPADISAGLVIIRGYPFNVMAIKEKKVAEGEQPSLGYYNDLPKKEDGSLEERVLCDAIGFSCALIKCDLLKKLPTPYFLTGANTTEDVYFCLKVQEWATQNSIEPRPEIILRTDIECGHLLNAEPIQWKTREKFQKFYAPATLADENLRPLSYVDRCKAELAKQEEVAQ